MLDKMIELITKGDTVNKPIDEMHLTSKSFKDLMELVKQNYGLVQKESLAASIYGVRIMESYVVPNDEAWFLSNGQIVDKVKIRSYPVGSTMA